MRAIRPAKSILPRLAFALVVALAILFLGTADIETWLAVNWEADRVPIFGFHQIIEPGDGFKRLGIEYDARETQQFLEYLARNDYWFLSTEDIDKYFLTHSEPIPIDRVGKQAIALSFDDGYKTVYTHLLPWAEQLEAKYNTDIKLILFVNPKRFFQDENSARYATCEELDRGVRAGIFDVQSHGFGHRDLTRINQTELVSELERGQTALRDCLGTEEERAIAAHFAYPFNNFNAKVREFTARHYQSAYSYSHEILKLGWNDDRYNVPRVRVRINLPLARMEQIARLSSRLKRERSRYRGRRSFNPFVDFL